MTSSLLTKLLATKPLIISIFVAPALAFAATIQVPQDQPTIQAGINAAQDGDLNRTTGHSYTQAASCEIASGDMSAAHSASTAAVTSGV